MFSLSAERDKLLVLLSLTPCQLWEGEPGRFFCKPLPSCSTNPLFKRQPRHITTVECDFSNEFCDNGHISEQEGMGKGACSRSHGRVAWKPDKPDGRVATHTALFL